MSGIVLVEMMVVWMGYEKVFRWVCGKGLLLELTTVDLMVLKSKDRNKE